MTQSLNSFVSLFARATNALFAAAFLIVFAQHCAAQGVVYPQTGPPIYSSPAQPADANPPANTASNTGAMQAPAFADGGVIAGVPVVAGSVPANSVPANSVPANSIPANSIPANSIPANVGSIPAAWNTNPPPNAGFSNPTNSNAAYPNAVLPNAKLLAPNASSNRPAFTSSTSRQATVSVRGASQSNRFRGSQNGTEAHLASSRPLGSGFRSPRNNPLESRNRNANRVLPYQSSSIRSARQNATDNRAFAESVSSLAAQVAQENANLADKWADLAEAHMGLSAHVQTVAEKLNATTRDYEDINAKLGQYGLTTTVGLLLRSKKTELDTWQANGSKTWLASQELENTRQHQLELEMLRYDGADAAGQTDQMLVDAAIDTARPDSRSLRTQIQDLLRQRYGWIVALKQGYHDYQQKLGELDSANTASTKLAGSYRTLINRHIIWIRSDDPISLSDVGDLRGGAAAFFDGQRTADFGPTLTQKLRSNTGQSLGWLVLAILIGMARWRSKTWLERIGTRKRMRNASSESRKMVAGVLTPLIALAIPAILYLFARWLGTGIVSESTLRASSAFYAASLVALAVEVPRQLLRESGYIDKHVDVLVPHRQSAMRYLTMIGVILVVAAYAITLTGLIDLGVWRGSTSRIAFMTAMLVTAWTAHRMLRPSGGFLEPLIAKFGGSVIHRIRHIIYLVGIGFPLLMFALSALGYGFTAGELIKRAIITVSCLLMAAPLWGSIKILAAKAWQRLTGTAPPPPKFDEYGEIPQEASLGVLAEHSLELKHQLAFLFQCALVIGAIACVGWLWIDVFPNVRMGNPVAWNVQDTVTESTLDANGQTITSTFTRNTPITALHLLLAAATIFVAFQLAKLLPAMFDALVLQRVSFDEGMEHFSLVLGRCLLFGVGCFIACRLIGIRWQTIQWLAVGLAIGLGFGLQDMVRNLFGGLIVLFEKPARLGDLVTVGNVTGRISAQRLRTTVVSDDQGREVTIPNKNFVSQDVVNWMGAGRLNVIPIEVAVSRDERPADICRMLQELVLEQPDILLTPAPQATLVCIAKQSQRIEVRAWIEEDKDVLAFRDTLLRIVRDYLREKKLLSKTQPSQPVMDNTLPRDIRHDVGIRHDVDVDPLLDDDMLLDDDYLPIDEHLDEHDERRSA